MPTSLDRLFGGMADTLRDTVLPTIDEPYSRTQVAACIELLGNLATRVEWRRDHLRLVTEHADAALAAAMTEVPDLDLVGMVDAVAVATPDAAPATRRDEALARVAAALRWLDEHPGHDAASTLLLAFAQWHVQHELELLRTGMFRA